MVIDIKRLEEFFFTAALESWAGKGKKTTVAELPKSKVLVCEDDDLRYVDLYFKALEGTESFGQTVIWNEGVPVWWMQYYGDYPERVIPFLKTALCEAYKNKYFLGGRGPEKFIRGDLVYLNHAEGPSVFVDFKGREEIQDEKRGYSTGYHYYAGGLLLPSIVMSDMIK